MGYISFSGEFHDFIEGDVRVIATDGIPFCVSNMVIRRDENSDCVCGGYTSNGAR